MIDGSRYFQPDRYAFWKWADNNNVIESLDGKTICFREDLTDILKALTPDGLPPLQAVLYILAAAKDDCNFQLIEEVLNKKIGSLNTRGGGEKLHPTHGSAKNACIAMLRIINHLPETSRKGWHRTHIINSICAGSKFKISSKESVSLINDFVSGNFDHTLGGQAGSSIFAEMGIQILADGFKQFPYAELLKLKLDSSVNILPKPLPRKVEIPEPLPTGHEDEDLLTRLEHDPETAGIARLTRQLIAAINIPRHARGSSERLLGGVSDITNKGDYDRLLLSELAYDDTTLMARLANNEALFLRREELPVNPEKPRHILIDSTLTMWGMPKVFAMASALTCMLNARRTNPVYASVLGEKSSFDFDIHSPDGIIDGLGNLSPAMHCFKGLENFMNARDISPNTEYFFITEERQIKTPEFISALSSLKQPLHFLITVNRNGHLQLFQFAGKGMKLVSSTWFDLDEVLRQSMSTKKGENGIPLFYSKMPFLFPSLNIKLLYTKCSVTNVNGGIFRDNNILIVTSDFRLLLYTSRYKGAIELMDKIEQGQYAFIVKKSEYQVMALNSSNKFLKLYNIDKQNHTVKIDDYSQQVQGPFDLYVKNDTFLVVCQRFMCSVDPDLQTVHNIQERMFYPYTNEIEEVYQTFRRVKNEISKFINNGYGTLGKVNNIYISQKGFLCLDRWELIPESKELIWKIQKDQRTSIINPLSSKNIEFAEINQKHIQLRKFTFADGSDIIVDSRGFLHLISSDPHLQEITIVLINNKNTTCWASDNVYCGNDYFINDASGAAQISNEEFYEKYIKAFISKLRKP